MDVRLADLRTEYLRAQLDERHVAPDPITQFKTWFNQAIEAEVVEPNAMTLATATRDGRPSSRIMLLKDVTDRGFSFFTNYSSRKGRELDENPVAALTFWWQPLERQVRIEGRIERMAADESDAYFMARPRMSQIGAWASPQSQVVPDREHLDRAVRDVETRHGRQIPRPDHWGGYHLIPESVEFWQGRMARLHDRIRYRRQDEGWTIERLAP